MHDAALLRRALEDLDDRGDQPLVGVGDHESHARDTLAADPPEEAGSRVVGLGVHHRQAQHAPPAFPSAADDGNHGGGGDPALPAALHVGGVEPDMESRRVPERPKTELVDVGVEARIDGAHLVLAEAGDVHLLGDSLRLARACAGGARFGDGGEGAVDPLVAPDHILGEETAGGQLGDAQAPRRSRVPPRDSRCGCWRPPAYS